MNGAPPALSGRRDRLRVIAGSGGASRRAWTPTAPRTRLSAAGGRPRLVVCGGDAVTRAALREELMGGGPSRLVLEAIEVWELLQLAPGAAAVVLAGDLHDAPVPAVLRLLAHRHPDLNVISLAGAAADPATAR